MLSMITFLMKLIIKNLKSIALFIFVAAISASISSAQCTNGKLPDPFNPTCQGTPPTIGDILGNILPIVPVAIGAALFVIILWGAIQIFSSGSSDDGKKKGIATIQNAITGIVILFLAVGIITIIETVIGHKILYGFIVR